MQDHAENCAAVTRAHLTQLMGLMSDGSARYAWYLDTYERSLPIISLASISLAIHILSYHIPC